MAATDYHNLPQDELLRQARIRYAALLQLAREDCATFCELALRHEQTGEPIANAPFHEEWHDAADSGVNMVVWAHPSSGKTQQFAIGRTLWMLGKDPRKRFAILSATVDQGEEIISAIKGHITSNPIVHDVFPNLRRGLEWAANSISVERPHGIKDPSVAAYGLDQGRIQGSRLDGLICDDILTETNTRTPYQREKVDRWVRASAFSRLEDGAQVVFLANAWHPEDLAHRLAREGWWSKRYPVLDEQGRPTWAEQWPHHRIEEQRTRLGPLEFARQMLCQARDESTARFQRPWLERCMQRGRGKKMPLGLRSIPPGYGTYTGVDLGVTQHSRSDKTVLFTILLHPDGSREVINVQSGRWTGPDILDKIFNVHWLYQSIVTVENNAAQDFILQFARQRSAIPVRPLYTSGTRKHSVEFGVESMAAELANGKWIIPCDDAASLGGTGDYNPGGIHPEIGQWLTDMLYYDPHAHTGDHLMAAWIAREGSRMRAPRAERGHLPTLRR